MNCLFVIIKKGEFVETLSRQVPMSFDDNKQTNVNLTLIASVSGKQSHMTWSQVTPSLLMYTCGESS